MIQILFRQIYKQSELQNYLVSSELMQEKERRQLNQLSMSELAGKTSLALQTHSNSKPHCVYTQIPINSWKTYTTFHSMLSAYEEIIKYKQKKMSKSNIQLLKLEAHRLDDEEVQPSRFGYQKIRQPATQIQLHPRVSSQPLPSKRKARSVSSMEKTNYHDGGKLRKKPWVSRESNFGTGEKLELSVQGWSKNTTKIGFKEVCKTRQATTWKTKAAQRTYMAGLCEKLSKTPFERSLGRKRKKQFQRRKNGINECIEGTKIQQLIRILDS